MLKAAATGSRTKEVPGTCTPWAPPWAPGTTGPSSVRASGTLSASSAQPGGVGVRGGGVSSPAQFLSGQLCTRATHPARPAGCTAHSSRHRGSGGRRRPRSRRCPPTAGPLLCFGGAGLSAGGLSGTDKTARTVVHNLACRLCHAPGGKRRRCEGRPPRPSLLTWPKAGATQKPLRATVSCRSAIVHCQRTESAAQRALGASSLTSSMFVSGWPCRGTSHRPAHAVHCTRTSAASSCSRQAAVGVRGGVQLVSSPETPVHLLQSGRHHGDALSLTLPRVR